MIEKVAVCICGGPWPCPEPKTGGHSPVTVTVSSHEQLQREIDEAIYHGVLRQWGRGTYVGELIAANFDPRPITDALLAGPLHPAARRRDHTDTREGRDER